MFPVFNYTKIFVIWCSKFYGKDTEANASFLNYAEINRELDAKLADFVPY